MPRRLGTTAAAPCGYRDGVFGLVLIAIPLGASVQVAALAGWRLTERGWPGVSVAMRHLLAAASVVVGLACLTLGVIAVGALGDAGGDCSQLSKEGATNVAIALAVGLALTAAFSAWAAQRSLRGTYCGAVLAWELAAGFFAFLMFAWILGGTTC
jgi:hypothetical protein